MIRDIDEKVYVKSTNYSKYRTLEEFDTYFYCYKFVNGIYLAGNSSQIFKSVDGENFEKIATGMPTINDVVYANGIYVFSTSDKCILYSYDLVTFTEVSVATSIYNVIYAFDKFIATGRNSAYYSADGVNWTSATVPQWTYTTDLKLPFYANGKVIAPVGNATGLFYTTTNGTTWTLHEIDSDTANEPWFNCIAFGNGVYIGCCYTSHVYISEDLENWTKVTASFVGNVNTIIFNNGTFVIGTSSGGFYTSKDGRTWSRKFSSLTTGKIEIQGVANGEVIFYERGFSPNHTKLYETVSSKSSTHEIINEMLEDTGWVDLELEGNVIAYSANVKPQVRRIRNQVFVRGAVKGVTGIGTNITYLPVGFRPQIAHPFSCPGTGNRHNRFQLNAAGRIQFEKSTETSSFTASDWYPLATTFLID